MTARAKKAPRLLVETEVEAADAPDPTFEVRKVTVSGPRSTVRLERWIANPLGCLPDGFYLEIMKPASTENLLDDAVPIETLEEVLAAITLAVAKAREMDILPPAKRPPLRLSLSANGT